MPRVPPSPVGRILPRRASAGVADALADTRVVLVNGARQCGKSTLVASFADTRDRPWYNLDHATTLNAARFDPTGFVESSQAMVIDEVQRAPELLLAIKEAVDADTRPGRFLLTGSSRLLALRALPDTLPGRMETLELWPLSQGEIDDEPDGFVDAVFTRGTELDVRSAETRSGYVERIVRGGFPEALARTGRRRERFFDAYVADLINRDVTQLSEIQRGREMSALVRLLAARSGQLLVPAALGGQVGLSRPSVVRYLDLLDQVFLIKQIPAWSRNRGTRVVSTPKLAFVDSGIAANLLGADVRRLTRPEASFGALMEGFVAMELARQLTWSSERAQLYHYRTKDKVEVDVVLENRRGQLVAIEVKAGATVRSDDFAGIRHFAARVGDDLLAGIVLYTGAETVSFGPRLRAMPISALWQCAA